MICFPVCQISVIACDLANPDDHCKAKACAVEMNFLKDLSGWIMFNQVDVEAYGHSYGNFDVDIFCENILGSPSDKECCGEYPTRFPFRTLDGARSCCGIRTYHTLAFECCSDNSLSVTCL